VGDFKYNVGVNGGYAKNKIEFWDEAPGAPEWQKTTGRPMNTFMAYIYDGVFKDQAAIDARGIDYSAIVKELRPGDMKYKDYNGDGKITPDDQVRTDFTQLPMFQGGVTLGAQYKNFDLGYRNISFEREAYSNEKDLVYLRKRTFWNFLKCI